jgi:hypothetical protein
VVRRDRRAQAQSGTGVTLNTIVKQIVAVMEGNRPDLRTREGVGLDQLTSLDAKRAAGISSPHAR